MKTQALSTLFKRNTLPTWETIYQQLGRTFFDLDGNLINRNDRPSSFKTKRLPAILDPNQTVTGDLVPSTSWGSSLNNLLTKTSWDKLRHPLIDKNHSICALCGKRFKQLDVHELWNYTYPTEKEIAEKKQKGQLIFGLQKLVQLIAVCQDCHLCFHLGYANVVNKLPQTLKRLSILNNWTTKETETYQDAITERFIQASKINWMLDMTMINHPEGGLTIKSPWVLHEQDNRFLKAPSKLSEDEDRITAIVGITWKFAKEKTWKPSKTANQML